MLEDEEEVVLGTPSYIGRVGQSVLEKKKKKVKGNDDEVTGPKQRIRDPLPPASASTSVRGTQNAS